jgi:sugar phosphate isomerase/epimerase
LSIGNAFGGPGCKTLEEAARFAAEAGFTGLEVDLANLGDFDIGKAGTNGGADYCHQFFAPAREAKCSVVGVTNFTHSRLMTASEAQVAMYEKVIPPDRRGLARVREWAQMQMQYSVAAAANMGIRSIGVAAGTNLYQYQYVQSRPAGLVEAGMNMLSAAWKAPLEVAFEKDVDVCFRLQRGTDLPDGSGFAQFLPYVEGNTRCNLLLDLAQLVVQGVPVTAADGHVRGWQGRIRMWHVGDAYHRNNRGHDGYCGNCGKFKALGDGGIDYTYIFHLVGIQMKMDLAATVVWDPDLGTEFQATAKRGHQLVSGWIKEDQAASMLAVPVTAPEPGFPDSKLLGALLGIQPGNVNATMPKPAK